MENLKTLRKNKKLTQEDMSKVLNVSRVTYSRYERGIYEPDNKTLIALSKYFNVSTDYLLGLIEVPFTTKEVSFMRKIYQEKDTSKIAEDFEVYSKDPDKLVTVKDLKEVIDHLKKLDKEVHGDFFKNKK